MIAKNPDQGALEEEDRSRFYFNEITYLSIKFIDKSIYNISHTSVRSELFAWAHICLEKINTYSKPML